jgi:spore coat protein CotH
VLDNVIQDPSFLHEPLAYQVFEAMGIASPAISYTRLTVNDEFSGVYWLIENIDKNFLAARFGGDKEGNLFKYEYVENYTFTDKGSDPTRISGSSSRDARGQAGRDRASCSSSRPSTARRKARPRWPRPRPFIDVDKFLTYVASRTRSRSRTAGPGWRG